MSTEQAEAAQSHHEPLPVLPSSGKVEQMRAEVQAGQPPQTEAAAKASSAEPQRNIVDDNIITRFLDPTKTPEQKALLEKVIDALKMVYDPEIPVNIYDLGLIYEIIMHPENVVEIKMTLTAPACPVAGTLPGEVERRVETVPEVKSAKVDLVWDPPWSRERMSEVAQMQLGFL
ncbi:MAG TPA: DUF59 domain-containing protein [Tepidisphaeraceae bacterium]